MQYSIMHMTTETTVKYNYSINLEVKYKMMPALGVCSCT